MTNIYDVHEFAQDVRTKFGDIVEGELTSSKIIWTVALTVSVFLITIAVLTILNTVRAYNKHKIENPIGKYKTYLSFMDNERQTSIYIIAVCFIIGIIALNVSFLTILEITYTPDIWIYKKFHNMEI